MDPVAGPAPGSDDATASATGGSAGLRVGRGFASIRTRIVLVILLSVLPLAAFSSVLAISSYRATSAQSLNRADAMLIAVSARIDERLSETADTLAVLSVSPGIDQPDPCAGIVTRASELNPGRFAGITVIEPATRGEICHTGQAVPAGDYAAWARGGMHWSDGAVVAPARDGGGEGILIPVVRLPVPNQPGSVAVVATLRVAGDLPGGSAWIVREGHAVERLSGNTAAPPAPALADGDAESTTATWRDPDGRQMVLAANRLPDGSELIVGIRASAREARARATLFWQFIAIAVVLALGLAAVAIGAQATVIAPLRALTRRVTRWRAGEGYDDSRLAWVPTELAELAAAFALATGVLKQREAELDRAVAEHELLFKEIHHRVKNNLQIIASLLNLQANRIRVPEAKAEFQSARDRVRALATLHRHLYADGGLHTIAMRSFLLELCGQLFQAIGEREGRRIQLHVEAPELQMSSDQAVPLALIVTEAVSNAVKYAFPGGRTGHVSVRLTLLADEQIELLIEDDGVGIPAGRVETETGIRDGLGIQLIRGFARQLAATLEVTDGDGSGDGSGSRPGGAPGGGGTRYRLVLRLRRDHHDEATEGGIAA